MNRFLSIAVLLVALIQFADASASRMRRDERTGHISSTREEILAKRERRKVEFGGRYEEYKGQLDDHHSGHRRLSEGEVFRLEKKVKAYERKLEQLHEEIDERVSQDC